MISFLESTLNYYLNLDPASRERARDLVGKKIVIDLIGTGLLFQMVFLGHSESFCHPRSSCHPRESGDPEILCKILDPRFRGDDKKSGDDESDLTIRATPLSLLQLKLSKSRRQILAERVTVEGDMTLAQKFTDFFDEIDIDWEEIFSKWFGDVPAYHAMRMVKRLTEMGKNISGSLTQQLNEYLHEEIKHFPAKEALEDFYQDVDDFRSAVDRLSARVQQLGEIA
ncbi:MAG: SCP2 sterol-binding domain-containing protein [Gammaproteobacteria bacterium]|nr:SCP2 sterol-binding domain-containing protein [Gammaproteobacteria bacterium]